MECHTCEDKVYFDRLENKWKIRIENGNWNNYLDSFDYTELDINFCYECGKDFRGVKSE